MSKGFPSMRWSPTGEARTFNAEHEVPEGWADKHPSDPNHTPPAEPQNGAAPAETLPMTRDEITVALTAGGIDFFPNTGTKKLYALLTARVQAVLTTRGIEFPADADARALLALIPAE